MSYLPAIEALKTEISDTKKGLSEMKFVLAKLISWQEGKSGQVTGVIDRQTAIELPPPPIGGSTLIGELRRQIVLCHHQVRKPQACNRAQNQTPTSFRHATSLIDSIFRAMKQHSCH